MNLRISTQPAIEPVTVDEIKSHLRLDTTADDALLASLGTAAREFAEKVTKRSLAYKGYVASYDRFPSPGEPIRIPAPPLGEVTEITYLDSEQETQTWDSSEYYVAANQEPALIVPKPGKVYPCPPRLPGSVEVHFNAGYNAYGYGTIPRILPEHLRVAIMQLAGHWYDHPEIATADLQNAVPVNLLDMLKANQIYVF